jgi:hypothetical protein
LVKIQPDTKARKKEHEVWGMARHAAILLGFADSKKLTGKLVGPQAKPNKRYRDA